MGFFKKLHKNVFQQPRLLKSSSELCPRMPDKETRDVEETYYTEQRGRKIDYSQLKRSATLLLRGWTKYYFT